MAVENHKPSRWNPDAVYLGSSKGLGSAAAAPGHTLTGCYHTHVARPSEDKMADCDQDTAVSHRSLVRFAYRTLTEVQVEAVVAKPDDHTQLDA